MRLIYVSILISLAFYAPQELALAQEMDVKEIPYLHVAPVIDGDLSDWKNNAFSEGLWDIDRVSKMDWYNPKRNKLIVHDGEDTNSVDLRATYYIAWDDTFIYFGAEVEDNVNDVEEANHEAKRWYYKDAVALFIETPRDTISEKFQEGDHAFCFVIDTLYPDYGAWWRHGSSAESYIEESLSAHSEYSIWMNPWNKNSSDYILEARINIKKTFGNNFSSDASMMFVHCDPDGSEYGGHLLIYGKGDDDMTWVQIKFIKK